MLYREGRRGGGGGDERKAEDMRTGEEMETQQASARRAPVS